MKQNSALVEKYRQTNMVRDFKHPMQIKQMFGGCVDFVGVEKLMIFCDELHFDDKGVEVYLKTLAEFIADYEREEFKAATVSGVEMLSYLMDLQGLNQADLSKELGGQPVVSKILKGERELNLRQIKALAKRFNVSPEVFI